MLFPCVAYISSEKDRNWTDVYDKNYESTWYENIVLIAIFKIKCGQSFIFPHAYTILDNIVVFL